MDKYALTLLLMMLSTLLHASNWQGVINAAKDIKRTKNLLEVGAVMTAHRVLPEESANVNKLNTKEQTKYIRKLISLYHKLGNGEVPTELSKVQLGEIHMAYGNLIEVVRPTILDPDLNANKKAETLRKRTEEKRREKQQGKEQPIRPNPNAHFYTNNAPPPLNFQVIEKLLTAHINYLRDFGEEHQKGPKWFFQNFKTKAQFNFDMLQNFTLNSISIKNDLPRTSTSPRIHESFILSAFLYSREGLMPEGYELIDRAIGKVVTQASPHVNEENLRRYIAEHLLTFINSIHFEQNNAIELESIGQRIKNIFAYLNEHPSPEYLEYLYFSSKDRARRVQLAPIDRQNHILRDSIIKVATNIKRRNFARINFQYAIDFTELAKAVLEFDKQKRPFIEFKSSILDPIETGLYHASKKLAPQIEKSIRWCRDKFNSKL